MGIAEISLDPFPLCQTGKCGKKVPQTILARPYTPGQTWEKSAPNHRGKPLYSTSWLLFNHIAQNGLRQLYAVKSGWDGIDVTATRAPAVLIAFELKNPLSSHQLLLVRDHAGPGSHSLHIHPDESLARVFRRSLRNSLRTQGRRVVEGQVGIACMEVE